MLSRPGIWLQRIVVNGHQLIMPLMPSVLQEGICCSKTCHPVEMLVVEASLIPETATTAGLRTTGLEIALCPSKMVVEIAIMVVEMVQVNSTIVSPLTTVVLVVVKVQVAALEPTLSRSELDGIGSLLLLVNPKPR